MDRMVHPGGRETELVNPNKLVRFYNGCDGLATGSNNESGYSGVFTAKRGESRYIAVVIGAKNNQTRASIAQKLLDHAFASFKSIKLVEGGKVIAQNIKVTGGDKSVINGIAGEDYALLARKGDEKQLKKMPVVTENLTAPIKKGDVVGELVVTSGETELARIPILAAEDVVSVDFASSFLRLVNNWLGK
jgi:D-alanyl-D-alanine carboxypeptidase (penicillin-binding protein 5/6)